MPDDAPSYSQAAVDLRERGDLAGAEAMIQEGRTRFPNFLGGAIIWANLAVRRGDWHAAADRWAVIRADFPDDPIGSIEGARSLNEAGDKDGAEIVASQGRIRFPDHFGMAVVWAEMAMRRAAWAEAVRRWTLLQAQFPTEILPCVECAVALRQAGDPDACRTVLRETQARFPTADRPLHDLARIAEQREDWPDAAALWHAYQAVMPDHWFGYTGEANALRRLARLDDAVTVLQAARRALPDAMPPLHDLARLAEQRQDWPSAERHWTEYRTARPDDWAGYTGAAFALRQSRQTDAARALLLQGVARLPGEANPLHDLARLAEEQADWPAAAAAWSAYRARFPPVWFSWAGHANALRQLGQAEAAEALFRDTVAQFPREVGPLMALADLLGAAGRWSDAIDAVDTALGHDPGNGTLTLMRADLAVKLDRQDDAFTSWQRISPDTPDLAHRKLLFACDILRLDATTPFAPELMAYLVSEPDTGAIGWLPRSAMLLHAMVLGPKAPIAALTAFFQKNPALFAASPHRLIWIAVLDLPPTDADAQEVIDTVVARGRIGLASFLFSIYVLNAREAWRAALFPRLAAHMRAIAAGQGDFNQDGPCLDAVLSLAIASMYRPDDFWPLLTTLIGRVSDDAAPAGSIASARRILARFTARVARAERLAVAPALVVSRDRPLRIAVCVSGQLRGYRDAFPTWRKTGLFDHQTRLFVHTWRDVGLNWMRNWDFFRLTHAAAYAVLARPEGAQTLADHFPTLAAAAEGGLAAAAHADLASLRDFYQTDAVALEDDTQPPFAGRPNDWKMLYKIQQAHAMALTGGEAFDLFVRIRPDIALDFLQPMDFYQMAHESARDHRLFMDSPVLFTAPDGKLKAGDQIAIGTALPMAAYANTLAFDPREAALLGAPLAPKAHETLGNALFAQGVLTSSVRGLRAKQLLNPAVLSRSQVAALAESDSAPTTDFARQFLDACRRHTEGARP